MENKLKDSLVLRKQVSAKIDIGYPAGNVRPDKFTVVAYIDGKPTPFEFKR